MNGFARTIGAIATAGVWSTLAACTDAGRAGAASGLAGSAGHTAADAALPGCEQLAIVDLVPQASRFAPGVPVRLEAELQNRAPQACSAALELRVTHLGQPVLTRTWDVELEANARRSESWALRLPNADEPRGYYASLSSSSSSGEAEQGTGFDVTQSPLEFPRYGYLSRFPPDGSQAEARDTVATLARRYHINAFQFYDWFWRHEDLIPEEGEGQQSSGWTDLFGRTASRGSVSRWVNAVHEQGAAALGYVAMYAAREGYEERSEVSPKWGLFESPAAESQVSLPFPRSRFLFLFDPSNSEWQEHMALEYTQAIDVLGFDGVQIDQFGPRPTLYRADGSAVDLDDTFASFLEAMDEALLRNDPQRAACIFNLVDGAVDGYGVDSVARTDACDVLYSEVWFSNNSYESLRAYVEQLRRVGRGRPVVLALYPQYGQDVGLVLEAESAELSGVAVDDDHSGYSGAGFVDEFDVPGDSIRWLVQLEDSTVSFVFRYANATGSAATRTLFVDGERVGQLRFGARPSWDQWAFDAWLQRTQDVGQHVVELRHAEGDTGSVNIDRLTLGAFDEASVRLQNAVVFASGATPIQLGDDEQSLAHEYFPNRSKSLTQGLRTALRDQYSFITAHETALFSPQVEPIEGRLEHLDVVPRQPSGSAAQQPPTRRHTLITDGTGGIWTVLRRAPAGDVIHLVNLVGVDNDLWRDPATAPTPQSQIELRYEIDDPSSVQRVSWATPDGGHGAFRPLEFQREPGSIRFTVPRLEYWSVVLVSR